MLPVEKATGQLWLDEQYLCETEYEISEPFTSSNEHHVQRIKLVVPDEHCVRLLNAYNLSLVTKDGQRHPIPRPFLHRGSNHLECYVESQ